MERPSNPSSVCLDSNVLIEMILGNSPAAKICAELVRLAEDEKITIVLSVLCYTEVRGYPNKKPYPPELDKKCLDFFDNARLLIVDVNRRVSLVARRLAHQYGYKPLDALHLATAVVAKADVFMTWDQDFGPGYVEGVWVDRPYLPGQVDFLRDQASLFEINS